MGTYETMFTPIQIKNMTIKNRIVMSPMGTNFGEVNGEMSFLHLQYYEQRAQGGTGLIIVENACVDYPSGSNGTTQIRIDNDNYIPRLYKLCENIHKHGGCVAIQLNHAGASAVEERIHMKPVSASDIPNKKGGASPRSLRKEELIEIAKKYAKAAKRAQIIGFDAVEIHAGHSYLISQFLSPLTNHRDDEFGGSYENRARFARMVMQEVRNEVGAMYPIIVRVSADELLAGGNTLEDTIELMKFFQEEADILDVSAGLSDSIQYQIDANYLADGWRSYMARAVKEAFAKPVITTGNIRDPKIAEDILAKGDADFIGMGRQMIADPEWVNKVQYGNEETIRKCISCNIGCSGHRIGLNRPIRCTVNPSVNEGEDYKKLKVTLPCNVVVIGGGTTGLEAACTAAEVGCTTFLIEKEDHVGGLGSAIAKIPDKKRLNDFPEYLKKRAKGLRNLIIMTSMDASIDFIRMLKPDVIVNATGSTPLLPPIKGLREHIDQNDSHVQGILSMIDHVDTYPQNLAGKEVVVVGGGAVGLDVVEFFAKREANVSIVEMLPVVGKDLDHVTKIGTYAMLEECNVHVRTNTALQEVGNDHFIVKDEQGEHKLPFDYGFVCLGMRANAPLMNDLKEAFKDEQVEIMNIGDSARARRIIDGVSEARNIISVLKKKGYL